MKCIKNKKGSILLISLMLLMVMLTLTILMFTQEFVSKNSAVRSRMSTTQVQTIEVMLQRFANTFRDKSKEGKTLPYPEDVKPTTDPDYNLSFEYNTKDAPGFKVKGKWKKGDSIYYPPNKNAGKDFTEVPQNGYYDKVTAKGYNNTKVPPRYNLLVLNTPLRARFIASYAYHFPYAAFAPNGKIKMRDAYGCTNPISEDNKNGDYQSGIPVNIYAKSNIEIKEYPYGKAYCEKGKITIQAKDGVLKFTNVSKSKAKETKNYTKIIRKQLENLYDNVSKVTLNKDKILFGRKITDVRTTTGKRIQGDVITLEQSKDFPYAALTINSNNPPEKELGNYYIFTSHCPRPPDNGVVSNDPNDTIFHAKRAYGDLDDIKRIFEDKVIAWEYMSTTVALGIAQGVFVAEIALKSIELAKAIAKSLKPPFIDGIIEAAIKAAELALLIKDQVILIRFMVDYRNLCCAEQALTAHLRGSIKNEPLTVEEDKAYNNTGWSFINKWLLYHKSDISRIFIKKGTAKYTEIGVKIREWSLSLYKTSHFGRGKFDDTWKTLKKEGFTYTGTFIVPRGRTFNFPHDMIIQGDLWIQDGASLYIGGKLKVEAPAASNLPALVKPSGRVFMGEGSSIIVEGDFQCHGSAKQGSVILSSPYKKVKDITSAIYSKHGNVKIPYGIMPGITIAELAYHDKSELPENVAKSLKTLINNSANNSKILGAFHFRKPFFASFASTVMVFRHTLLESRVDLPLVIALKYTEENLMNLIFPQITESFTLVLNAYLGENTSAHADWWIFGDGIIPILPKMDVDRVAAGMSNLSGIENVLQQMDTIEDNVNSILTGDSKKEIIKNAQETVKDYMVYYDIFHWQGSTADAEKRLRTLIDNTNKRMNAINSPFKQLITQVDNMGQSLKTAVNSFTKYYNETYSTVQAYLPGGSEQKEFIECPGVMVYAKKNIDLGTTQGVTAETVLPASGLFIAEGNINVKGTFRVVGSFISLDGDINAPETHLRYYPFFSQASIYVPRDVDGDVNKNLDLITDNELKSNTDPCNVGITIPRIYSEGWEHYSEYYDYKSSEKTHK